MPGKFMLILAIRKVFATKCACMRCEYVCLCVQGIYAVWGMIMKTSAMNTFLNMNKEVKWAALETMSVVIKMKTTPSPKQWPWWPDITLTSFDYSCNNIISYHSDSNVNVVLTSSRYLTPWPWYRFYSSFGHLYIKFHSSFRRVKWCMLQPRKRSWCCHFFYDAPMTNEFELDIWSHFFPVESNANMPCYNVVTI